MARVINLYLTSKKILSSTIVVPICVVLILPPRIPVCLSVVDLSEISFSSPFRSLHFFFECLAPPLKTPSSFRSEECTGTLRRNGAESSGTSLRKLSIPRAKVDSNDLCAKDRRQDDSQIRVERRFLEQSYHGWRAIT